MTEQQRLVMDHLKNLGSLSAMEAKALYRVSSLSKVISLLRLSCPEIRAEWKRDNTGRRYRRYSL